MLVVVIALLVWVPAVSATHGSGQSQSLVGFSTDGTRLMLRESELQRGTQRFVILSLAGPESRTVHPVGAQDNAMRLEWALRATYGIDAVGMIGPVSPDGSGALLWLAEKTTRQEWIEYRLVMHDGSNVKEIHRIRASNACGSSSAPLLRTHTHWSPDGKHVMVLGDFEQSESCDSPSIAPIAIRVSWRPKRRAGTGWKRAAKKTIKSLIRPIERVRSADALLMARQWLALDTDSPKALTTVARLQAKVGDPLGAIGTLWALRAVPNDGGMSALRRAVGREWAKDLNTFVAFRALQWELRGVRP